MLLFHSRALALILIAGLSAAVAQEAPAPAAGTAPEPAAAPAATGSAPAAATTSDGKPKDPPAITGPLPGHSFHAEVFNEGPRQKAYLMPGMPRINFPATTKVPEAQSFINQGVGQLHGFWYYEAERSFRQAAALDKDCGMAYWGMAMANIDNHDRSKKFMEECVKHKDGLSDREKMWIDALDAFVKADQNKKKERNEAYTRALEQILYKFPDDLEARAFLALQIWKNREAGIPITSHIAIDAVLDQVFRVDPMHPAHHYRIHLWDYEKAENALESANKCGQSSPGIAHMWHMPGHIYSRTRRYDDACWQQEASARVDHAHMMRDRVMPDQIHNFAHNNEWLIRNMLFIGRLRDSIDLAKNMCELPRHPKYNTLDRMGSTGYGRLRLYDAVSQYELWDELIALSNTPYLDATDKEAEQVKWLRRVGMASYRKGDSANGDAKLAELRKRLADHQAAQDKAVADAEMKAKTENKPEADINKAKEEAKKGLAGKINDVQKGIDELLGHQAVAAGAYKEGLELLKKAGGIDATYLATIQYLAGETDEALKAVQDNIRGNKNEILPLAAQIDLLWRAGKKEDAKKTFDELREISGSIDSLALAAPPLKRLEPIAQELNYPADWRVVKPPRGDIGVRPSLDALGPFRWQPSPALDWTLKDVAGHDHSLADYRGRPVVVIFFLGNGCLHCAEQLQKFAKAHKEFEDAGLSLIAISSDDSEGLKKSIENYKEGPIPIPLVSDNALATFKAYRCYDDFENQTLHGTFLIDGAGLVRWQDISFQPFMDHQFVIGEAQRLLGAGKGGTSPPANAAAGR
jgi:peroxiredoxin